MKKNFFLGLLVLGIALTMLYSCKKDIPEPTAEIYCTIAGYQVTFAPQVTNTDTYSWNFGDGSTASMEANPVHMYESFGDYTVTLSVTGGGGTVTTSKVISIAATSLKDLLTGGKSATGGKTWVISTAYAPGKDGGGPVTSDMPVLLPSAENVLTMFGFGDEYDNEYTFFYNGNYSMNLKNGKALAGAVYGVVTQTISGKPNYSIGLCVATYTAPAGATWTLHNESFTVDAITDPNTSAVPPVHGNVTFTGKNWVSFTTGAYFGILDFPVTAKFIIKEISSDKMNVAMFLCGYGYGTDPKMMMLPTNLMHITFVKK